MTPTEIIRHAQATTLIDEDGEPVRLELFPPLSESQIDAFAARLPCPLPDDVRQLLAFCRGFTGTVDIVDFTGEDCSFEQEDVFPHGLPIAGANEVLGDARQRWTHEPPHMPVQAGARRQI